MRNYKSYQIDGMAIPDAKTGWYARGLVFDARRETLTEIKRLECRDLRFSTKSKANKMALELCKAWLNGALDH